MDAVEATLIDIQLDRSLKNLTTTISSAMSMFTTKSLEFSSYSLEDL